ncbi:NADPH-dependent oxidoreductase [Enterococcus florum]|uniref:NADPH-dependent oxidoreductase n=1 Tax=Enterococcus florum TaxID=2480627 RepID=A0A4P5PBZ5_9ENTE|nr:oxygen-insensitive NADPH nitroreductase [Enterococcus florum]GCF92962.1 NADPH-dependent oxidoreductase [Enterococcus florum]
MDLLQQLITHSSVRSFTAEKLSPTLRQNLLKAAQSGSSSNFVQAYSIIEVSDPQKLEAIERLANGIGYIKEAGAFYIFVADLNKHAQILQYHQHSLEALENEEAFTVAVVDATIAAQTMSVYAESLGLGICYIGGIRNDLFQIAELLKLPKYTFPLFGLSVGYPDHENEVKPRLPIADIHHMDSYHPITIEQITEYDKVMKSYYAKRSSNPSETDWSTNMLTHFYEPRRSHTKAFLKEQGFVF